MLFNIGGRFFVGRAFQAEQGAYHNLFGGHAIVQWPGVFDSIRGSWVVESNARTCSLTANA